MCTLAAYVGVSAELPLIVAANRDEFLDRPATDPGVIGWDPWIVAGQDLTAGGTWFGVNEHGMVVGLLNRRRAAGVDPARRSRGLLCLEVLQTRTLSAAADLVAASPAGAYNSYNLLVADREQAFVASNALDRVTITPLPRGVHLLTNLELNDPTCPRIAKSSALFRDVAIPAAGDATRLLAPLQAILSDHTTALDPRATSIDTLCVHLPGYGTRSSSVVVLDARGRARYWHAPGPPCRTPYEEVGLPSAPGAADSR